MATCEPAAGPSALGWLAARRRWLVLALGLVVLTGLIGITAIADSWLERAVWLASVIAAMSLVSRFDQWRYHCFLVRSDRAWIAGLRVPDNDRRGRFHEMMERLRTRWGRGRRGQTLAEAIAACLAWIEAERDLPLGWQRELVVQMCATVQEASRDAASSAACLDRLRRQLIDIDRGRLDCWQASMADD
jgi:hypothetical protein